MVLGSHLLERVGLPPPESVHLSDQTLKDEYTRFCRGIEIIENGKALTITDGAFFIFSFSNKDKLGMEFARLRLLAALIRPRKKQLEEIRTRTHLIENVYRGRGALYELSIATALKEFEQFLVSDDCPPSALMGVISGFA